MTKSKIEHPKIVSRDQWLVARKEFLIKEKKFTCERDALNAERAELPWVKVDKEYIFEGSKGKQTLSELFEGRSQLLVYHFMFDPAWQEGCKSCSFWADNFNGIITHLNQRDVTMIAVSKAPFEQLEAFKKRMGWSFKWVSAFHTDFNRDYQVSFTKEELEKGEVYYNYDRRKFSSPEAAGISVFYKDKSENLFHTYSCYARGLDMLNGAYHFLDLVPKGRDEAGLPYTMAWVRHHHKY